jgi:CTP:molybdopterin cytidylyltransferase MocA
MTVEATPAARRDQAVVLARGLSSRMGKPKGLVRLPDDDRPLLVRIVDLYLEIGMPVLVVSLKEIAPEYGDLLSHRPEVEILPAEGGAGTARTLAIAWMNRRLTHTHLWAHPVDVPLVRCETLTLLRQRSTANPQRVTRPAFGKQPGHPVVLPCPVLDDMDALLKSDGYESGGLLAAEGDMREMLKPGLLYSCGSELDLVEVPDQGVVRDFDTPQSNNQ